MYVWGNTIGEYLYCNFSVMIVNLAKQGYCNHFVCLFICLSVYLFICFLCVRYATQHNTWNITRNVMMLYHEAFMYFILGESRGVLW